MTTQEFRDEFNLGYNNILGEGAPGLDVYEISVYLTTAQEELVKSLYYGNNSKVESFEDTERNRRALNNLVENYSTDTVISTSRNLVAESKFYELPSNLMFIVNETVLLNKRGDCQDNKIVMVKPITHDEFMVSYRNPFRKPDSNKVWRIDLSKERGTPVVEIISEIDLRSYRMRYIRYPEPIIIANFETNSATQGLGLTINGENTITQCELNEYYHRDILNRAIELAIKDYRENNLSNEISLNERV